MEACTTESTYSSSLTTAIACLSFLDYNPRKVGSVAKHTFAVLKGRHTLGIVEYLIACIDTLRWNCNMLTVVDAHPWLEHKQEHTRM